MLESGNRMELLAQTSLIVSVLSFALGASILARNVKNRLYVAFFLLTTLICGWGLFFFLEVYRRGGLFYRFHLGFNVWLAPVGLYFMHELLKPRYRVSRFLLVLSFLLATVLTAVLLLGWDRGSWLLQVVYFAPGLVVIQILTFFWREFFSKRSSESGDRSHDSFWIFERRFPIYVGALLVLSLCVMDHVPRMGHWVPSIGNALLGVYLFFLSLAVLRQRFLDLGTLFSRFLVLLTLALTLTGLYSLLYAWIQNRPALFLLNSFVISLLLVSVLGPIERLVQALTRRLLTAEHRRLDTLVKQYEARLMGVADSEAIFEQILEFAEKTVQPIHASLFVLRTEGTHFTRVKKIGDLHNQPEQVMHDHMLLQRVREVALRGAIPVLLDPQLEIEQERSVSRAQKEGLQILREGLHALDSNLLLPLLDRDQLLGFIACQCPEPPNGWGGNWGLLSALHPYFQSAARALHGLEAFSRQKEKERLAALGEMAAGLAHEIRNPLGAIRGAAQLLDSDTSRPESRFAHVIVEEVDRLNRVVTQFLDYSRRDSFVIETVDLVQLIERIIELMRPTLPSGVHLEFSKKGSNFKLQGSPVQLHQLILNLLQNSVQALNRQSQQTTKKIKIELRDSEELQLIVEDNGPGIAKDNLKKLFIPFFTTSPKGTGLGLSICQKIASAHGGHIDVSSELDRFARFTVVFPGRKMLGPSL